MNNNIFIKLILAVILCFANLLAMEANLANPEIIDVEELRLGDRQKVIKVIKESFQKFAEKNSSLSCNLANRYLFELSQQCYKTKQADLREILSATIQEIILTGGGVFTLSFINPDKISVLDGSNIYTAYYLASCCNENGLDLKDQPSQSHWEYFAAIDESTDRKNKWWENKKITTVPSNWYKYIAHQSTNSKKFLEKEVELFFKDYPTKHTVIKSAPQHTGNIKNGKILLNFLLGIGRDNSEKTPSGVGGKRLLADIIGDGDIKGFDNNNLEAVHNYIQRIFPTCDRGLGYGDDNVIVTTKEFLERLNSPNYKVLYYLVKQSLRRSLKRMMNFYGMEVDRSFNVIVPTEDYYKCIEKIKKPRDHNHLRWSRILESLHEFGMDNENEKFFRGLIWLIEDKHLFGKNLDDILLNTELEKSMKFWRDKYVKKDFSFVKNKKLRSFLQEPKKEK